MHDDIVELISGVRPDLDFSKEKNLLSEEKLDSFDIISILALLSEKYQIEIDPDLICEKYFDDVDGISSLIELLKNG